MNPIPFDPFSPLPDALQALAAPRDEAAAAVRHAVDPHFRVGLVVGKLGVGKSTLLRVHCSRLLRDQGWEPVYVAASPNLSAHQLFMETAAAIGFRMEKALARVGIMTQARGDQTAGAVSDSVGVTVVQAYGVHVATPDAEITCSDLPTALSALAQQRGAPIAILLDQLEQVFLGSRPDAALKLLEALARASQLSGQRVATIFAIRDQCLHCTFPLFSAFPQLASRIVPLDSLPKESALEFLNSAIACAGADFSTTLVEEVLSRLGDEGGRIWPVALHATLRPLAELSRDKQRKVNVRDLQRLGDLSGIVGKAVRDALERADPHMAADALFCLHKIADSCRIAGNVAQVDVLRQLPAYPPEDVIRMLQLLVGLRLVEVVRHDSYRLGHDSIYLAVQTLRAGTLDRTISEQLDESLLAWTESDRLPTSSDARRMLPALAVTGLATPHIVMLGCCIFRYASFEFGESAQVFKEALRRRPEDQIVRVVRQHALRHGRNGALSPDEVYVLTSSGYRHALKVAVSGLRAASAGSVPIWREFLYFQALSTNALTDISEILLSLELTSWPLSGMRVIVRTLRENDSWIASEQLMCALWTAAHDALRPEVLLLAANRSVQVATVWAEGCIRSDRSYLRAAAADACANFPLKERQKIIETALGDAAATVRRRGVYAIHGADASFATQWLELVLTGDESPLVRESCLEVISRSQRPEWVPRVVAALGDPVDYVRESAVYALAHLLAPSEAIQHLSALLRDEAPRVREAVLRIWASTQVPPDPQIVLQELRKGTASGRAAAAQLLVALAGHDLDLVLEDMLSDHGIDRNTRLLCIRAARRSTGDAVYSRLVSQLASDDDEVVCEVVAVLQDLAWPVTVEVLEAAVFHSSADVRERVVYALGEIGGPSAVNSLICCLADPVIAIRVRAVFALGRLEAKEARVPIGALSSQSEDLREAIGYFWERVGDGAVRS